MRARTRLQRAKALQRVVLSGAKDRHLTNDSYELVIGRPSTRYW
jgi:hypothetical protein